MKKVMDPDPAGQKSTDPTGPGSSSLHTSSVPVNPHYTGSTLECFFLEGLSGYRFYNA